jgi:hypothetical protein
MKVVMENIALFLSLAGTIIGLIVSLATVIVKLVKNGKAKKAAEQIIAVGNAVVPYIEKAETFVNFSGAEKKEYVMTKANQFAIDNGIAFDAEGISNKIEELVELTKKVNKRDDRKPAAPSPAASAKLNLAPTINSIKR